MPSEFKIVRRVEFSETDMAGIVHYSNYFKYMETAEHAFFRSLGFSIAPKGGEWRTPSGEKSDEPAPTPVGWPRVHAECDFKQPLYFEDEVEVQLLVTEKRSKALSYLFIFRKLNANPSIEVGRGRLTVVCVKKNPDGKMAATQIPKEIADKIEVAPQPV